MPYLPAGTPRPEPTPEDAPFWDHVARRELRIQRCCDCGQFRHPPMPRCPGCRSAAVDWAPVSGAGVVFSYTVVRHAAHVALRDALPYNIVVVELAGTGGVRLVSNLVDSDGQDPVIGQPVALFWEDNAEGDPLPRFRPLSGIEGVA